VPYDASSSAFLAHPAFQGAVALAFASTMIPLFVAIRYGAQAARFAVPLWPAVTIGAFFLGVPLHSRFVALAGEPYATVLVLTLYAIVLAHLGALVFPKLRGRLFRGAVLYPGTVLTAAALLALPIGLLVGLFRLVGVKPSSAADWFVDALELLPLALSALAVGTSTSPRRETVRVHFDGMRPKRVVRAPSVRERGRGRVGADAEADEPGENVLRIAQLSDVHLGGLVTVPALRGMVERLVARKPDLVLLTGDYLALEGMFSPGALAEALLPLKALPGRCFAVRGNHDLDAPDLVAKDLAAAGVRLLIDETALVRTRVGRVEIVGVDHQKRDRARHLRRVLRSTRVENARLRVVLLHDPARFADLEPPWPELVLSGHVHGGQIGLLSVGLAWTILRPMRVPDHGLFAYGLSRLYVHRGTGTFGFPLRVGVPGEESVLDVDLDSLAAHREAAPAAPAAAELEARL
jgi:predicted MPP superfamily phosphohydrolase